MRAAGKAGRSSASAVAITVVVCGLLALVPAVRSGESEAEPETDRLAVATADFCRRFLDAEFEGLREMMSAEMRSAMPEGVARQIHDSIVGRTGPAKRIGEAWKEAEQEGFVRYRLPVEFEAEMLDLRVVFDDDGKVAGFFQVPHEERPAPSKPNPAVEGRWEGKIEIPGSPLPIIVELGFRDGLWSGSFDSPMQGAKGIELGGIVVEGAQVRFAIVGVPGDPTFQGELKDGEIRGSFTQLGRSYGFVLGRESVALPARPQEPRPPFPYEQEAVEFSNGAVRLAGTLTLPQGAGPFPAAVLISGSGAQDRNEEVFGHKPFLVLADHLTRAGIAVLRADDRGVGGSGGSLASATTADLAGDALAALRLLRDRPRIDPNRIGLIGHSEGAVIAPLAASETDEVAFVVMLAGTGVPGDQVLARQMKLLLLAEGVDAERVAQVLAAQRELLDLVLEGATAERLAEPLGRLTAIQLAVVGAGDVEPKELDAMVRRGVAELASPWFRYFVAHDPAVALSKLDAPLLALWGSLDLQVEPDQNLPAVRAALGSAGNEDATLVVLEGLNHLFQKAESGAVDEYARIEETLNPAALTAVRDWILARFATK